jgi:hypothetical protein
MRIFDCEQRSTEWRQHRAGVVTASGVDALITPEFRPRTGETPKTYLCRKIAERLIGCDYDGAQGTGYAADQGTILENIAIPWFEFENSLSVQRVGFILSDDGRIGCSPDGLIGEDCGIEAKCPQPHTQVKYLSAGKLPPEYSAQVHFSMWVTGRPFWWFLSYSRYLPKLVVRVERDEKIIAKLAEVVLPFVAELDSQCQKIRALEAVAFPPTRFTDEPNAIPF